MEQQPPSSSSSSSPFEPSSLGLGISEAAAGPSAAPFVVVGR